MEFNEYKQQLIELMMKYKHLFDQNSSGKYEVYCSDYLANPLKEIIPGTYQNILKHISENISSYFNKQISERLSKEDCYHWLVENTKNPKSFEYILHVPEEFWPVFKYDSDDIINTLHIIAYIEIDSPSIINGVHMPLDIQVHDVSMIKLYEYSSQQDVLQVIYSIGEYLKTLKVEKM
ncbi:hypothetical protein ACFSCX_09730 [Bacillus salitolerans]|uniref:Uncharacterized protein n=1 Tax=Bacillus salitolerans TaxID=1437434 RepID=A0ABW4LP11_9BACI